MKFSSKLHYVEIQKGSPVSRLRESRALLFGRFLLVPDYKVIGGPTACTKDLSQSVEFNVAEGEPLSSSHFSAHCLNRPTIRAFLASSCSKHQAEVFAFRGMRLGMLRCIFGPCSPGICPKCHYSWLHQVCPSCPKTKSSCEQLDSYFKGVP